MKAKIKEEYYENGNYNFKNIVILTEKYGRLQPSGHLHFQQTKGMDTWYAMRFVVDTDDLFNLLAFTKVAKYIRSKSDWDSQPNDIKKIIKAIEHVYDNVSGQFVPKTK